MNKLSEEIKAFKNNNNIHNLPKIQNYWSENYLKPKFNAIGFNGMWDFYVKKILESRLNIGLDKKITIVSIGSGNCDVEIKLAQELINFGERSFRIECVDINPDMLSRGRSAANKGGISDCMIFTCGEVSSSIFNQERGVDIFFANQSLHHIVKLEELFAWIDRCMEPKGSLILGDMIGRNGHAFWPEQLFFINMVWEALPAEKKFHNVLSLQHEKFPNTDHSTVGFEGIRSQDILPLLVKFFKQDTFLGFSSIVRPFISRGYGPNFLVDNAGDIKIIDMLSKFDDYLISHGICKPTQCFGVFKKINRNPPISYLNWTASYCVRDAFREDQIIENLRNN